MFFFFLSANLTSMLKKILNDIKEMIGRYENSYHLSVAKKKERKKSYQSDALVMNYLPSET